jgi:hypothetical protein
MVLGHQRISAISSFSLSASCHLPPTFPNLFRAHGGRARCPHRAAPRIGAAFRHWPTPHPGALGTVSPYPRSVLRTRPSWRTLKSPRPAPKSSLPPDRPLRLRGTHSFRSDRGFRDILAHSFRKECVLRGRLGRSFRREWPILVSFAHSLGTEWLLRRRRRHSDGEEGVFRAWRANSAALSLEKTQGVGRCPRLGCSGDSPSPRPSPQGEGRGEGARVMRESAPQ